MQSSNEQKHKRQRFDDSEWDHPEDNKKKKPKKQSYENNRKQKRGE